jgi:hypothetical protein
MTEPAAMEISDGLETLRAVIGLPARNRILDRADRSMGLTRHIQAFTALVSRARA